MVIHKNTIHNSYGKVVCAGIVLLMVLAGCNNFLDQKPLAEQTAATFFEDQQDAIEATNATYSTLREWGVHVFSWIGMTDIVSDDANKGSTPTDAPFLLEMDNLTFTASNSAFSDTWSGYYKGIYRANLAIANIPDIKMSDNIKARLIAENEFLRAYFYFFLVRAYGNVPLITRPLKPGEYDQRNSTPDSVYTQIISDLKDASAVLPLKSQYAAADLGRATKGAAQALLAKVYLFRQDYENAQLYADSVINSGEYTLYPDYAGIFRISGENSSGSIFEVQCTATETGNAAAQNGSSQYGQVQGVRGTPNLGWGFNQPTRDLEASYESGDPRQEGTILYVWENVPNDASVTVHDNPQLSDERYNQKAYSPQDHPGGQGVSPVNIRILRYSDILLVAAEAAYQNGDIGTAQKDLNEVRARAREGRTSTIGVSVEDMPSIIADTLGAPQMTGMPVIRYVWKGSPAEAAGLKPFTFSLANSDKLIVVSNLDVIQSVNGQPVTSKADYLDALKNVSPGQTVAITGERFTQTYSSGSTATTTTQNTVATVTAQALLPDITATGQQLLHDIWHERRVELAMEQHRWFDIVRQNAVEPGRATQLLQADGKTWQDKFKLYPIPQTEIDLSNGSLHQNPGW